MVCMPALSFYLSYPCCGTGNFRKKQKTRPLSHTWAEITKAPGECFLWSEVFGFVLFYCAFNFLAQLSVNHGWQQQPGS